MKAEAKLYTRKDYQGNSSDDLTDEIVEALGGVENIKGIDACITRLRVTVKDSSKVAPDSRWKELKSQGVIRSGEGIQIIYGTQAEIYKNKIIKKYGL